MTPDSLSQLFDLQLNHPQVPVTCRQMYDVICSLYRAIKTVNVTNRQDLYELYRRFQLIPNTYSLPVYRSFCGVMRFTVRYPTLSRGHPL
jgi:hypothetical protein